MLSLRVVALLIDDNEPAAATDVLEGNESDGNQGA
jgi:hypothetical protein